MPGPLTPFHRLVAALDYPMLVVTVTGGGERSGCLVGFSTQCSIDPARYLVCVSKANHTHRVAMAATHVAVHVLGPDDRALAELFGQETGDEVDKFAACRWRPGPAGVPVLADVRGWFTGPVVDRIDGGDHTIVVVDVTDSGWGQEGEPADAPTGGQLGFQAVKELEPGHEP